VVPLQDLVEHDPVEEPAESEPEQDGGQDEPGPAALPVCVVHGLPVLAGFARRRRIRGRVRARLAIGSTLRGVERNAVILGPDAAGDPLAGELRLLPDEGAGVQLAVSCAGFAIGHA
jgi:hypothetical protein